MTTVVLMVAELLHDVGCVQALLDVAVGHGAIRGANCPGHPAESALAPITDSHPALTAGVDAQRDTVERSLARSKQWRGIASHHDR